MTKLSEAEKQSMMLWNMVVNALLNQIQHHQDQVLVTVNGLDPMRTKMHVAVMHRTAKTLAVFTNPSDD